MFCDRCGTQLQATYRCCPSCGKPIVGAQGTPAAPPPPQYRVAGHIRNLAIFWIAYSALQLASGWFVGSILPRFFDFWTPHVWFFPRLFGGIGVLLAARGVLGIIVGWGLLERQAWARIGAIVLGVINLIHPLLGTLLGVYTLWVLLPSESEREYRGMVGAV